MRIDKMPTATASAVGHGAGLSTRRASTTHRRDDILTLIRECDALLHVEPTCLHTRAVRGHACMKAKMWDRAVADFTEILESRPEDIHARFSRGMALFKAARVDHAHADFSRVLELNPHHVMARYARAGCYNTEGKFHHAIEEYTIALQHDEMENELVHDARTGKLSRGRYHDGGSLTRAKVSEEDRVREQQRAQERRATLDAAAWSPPRQSVPVDSRRESAPVLTSFQKTSDTTLQPTTTTGKRPRKVVQVQLNLSDFVAVPNAPQARTAIANPHISTSTPSEASQADGRRLSAPPPPAAPQEISPDPPSPQSRASYSTPCHLTQSSNGGSGREIISTNSPIAIESQAPRRAVRRVTIAL